MVPIKFMLVLPMLDMLLVSNLSYKGLFLLLREQSILSSFHYTSGESEMKCVGLGFLKACTAGLPSALVRAISKTLLDFTARS